LPGGLAIVAMLVLSFLTAFTGASGVTIVALGGLLLPALVAEGYRERFALGLVTSGGNMGVLFAPSLPLILYAIIANPLANEVTLDRLFLACLLPGLLCLALLSGYALWAGHRDRVPRERFSWGELRRALWAARWELPLPFVVLGGIYSGKLAVSEAAVITAGYTVVAEVLLYREVHVRQLGAIIRDSMVLVGGILAILGLGMAITNYLVNEDVPARALAAVQAHLHNRVTFLIALNVFLLIVGCLMDIYTAIVVIVPLIVPMAQEFGVHPVHLGVIFLANLGIGYSTPPVGMNLFIGSIRFGKPVAELYRASVAFILVLLVALLLITYLPVLSLWAVK
jgi:tripartite ATP-independent transporter DctM subunit